MGPIAQLWVGGIKVIGALKPTRGIAAQNQDVLFSGATPGPSPVTQS